ncbi:hypothetical protein ES705_20198 [subsurface metagenome]
MNYYYSDPAFYDDQYYIDDVLGGLIQSSDDWNDIFYPISWEEGNGYNPSEHIAACADFMDTPTILDWDMLYRDVVYTGYFDPFYENTEYFYDFWWRGLAEVEEENKNEAGNIQDLLGNLTYAYKDFDIGIQSDGRAVLYPTTADLEFNATDPLDKYVDMFKLYYIATYNGAYEYASLNANEIKIRSLGLEIVQIAVGIAASRIGSNIGQSTFPKYYPQGTYQPTAKIKLTGTDVIVKTAETIGGFVHECFEELLLEQIVSNICLSVGFTKDWANLLGEIAWSTDVLRGLDSPNLIRLEYLQMQYATLTPTNMDLIDSLQGATEVVNYHKFDPRAYEDAKSLSFDKLVHSVRTMQAVQNELSQNLKVLQQLRLARQVAVDQLTEKYIKPRGYSQEETDNFLSIRYSKINNAYNIKGDMQLKLLEVLLEHGDSWENFLQALKDNVIGQDHLAWVNIRFPNGYSLKIGIINSEVQVSVTDSSGRWLGFRSPGIAETPIGLAKEGGMFEIVDPADKTEIEKKITIAEKIKSILSAADSKSNWQTLGKHLSSDDRLNILINDISNSLETAKFVKLSKNQIKSICFNINKKTGEYTTLRLKLGEGLSASELYGKKGDEYTALGKDPDGNWITGTASLLQDGILSTPEHLKYKPENNLVNIKITDSGAVGGNFISLYSLLKHPILFNYILSGKIVLSTQSYGNINSFIKLTQPNKDISKIKENTKKISQNVATFALTSMKSINNINKKEDFISESKIIKRIITQDHIDLRESVEYWRKLLTVGRCIQQHYPGLGTTFVNLMSPLIETDTGTKIPLSKWIHIKYGKNQGLWDLKSSQLPNIYKAGNGRTMDDRWLNPEFKTFRTIAIAIVKYIELADQLRAPNSKTYMEITKYLQNLNEYIANSEFEPGKYKKEQTRIYNILGSRGSPPTLPEALNLDRLIRWFSIPFELMAQANLKFSNEAKGQAFTDMQGFPADATFDDNLKFDKAADYRTQFMNWHTAKTDTTKDTKYYLGDGLYIRSALFNYFRNTPFKGFDTWKAYKNVGLYYLSSKNSIRNRDTSTQTKIEYMGRSVPITWKTSKVEQNGNQPVTKRALPDENFEQGVIAPDTVYELFPIGHDENPHLGAFVIDYEVIVRELRKRKMDSMIITRPRVSYEDYISHINNMKNEALLYLKTAQSWIGRGKVINALPFSDIDSFFELYISDLKFQKVVNNAMRSEKPCWADLFMKFNDNGKEVYHQIEFLGKGAEHDLNKKLSPKTRKDYEEGNNAAKIYRKVKQNDNEYAFTRDKMPTIYVCETEADKLAYLKDHAKIGFNTPILTKAEYFAWKKAKWYAYAEMTHKGVNRDDFDYKGFIQNLAAKAADWHIDADIAIQIMGSFGYCVDKFDYSIVHRFTGSEKFIWMENTKYEFNFGVKSSTIALSYFNFLDLSSNPLSWPYKRYHRWFSIL